MSLQYQDKELLNKIILTIKQVRKKHGVTLENFYFDTGIHLARIEQGKTIFQFLPCLKFVITLI